jgi:hypothetical protein
MSICDSTEKGISSFHQFLKNFKVKKFKWHAQDSVVDLGLNPSSCT